MAGATGIGPWTVGQDLTSITIQALQVTGTQNGTSYTPVGQPFQCGGLIRRVNQQTRIATKDIRPINQVQENQVPISIGTTLQITNLRVYNASNVLGGIFAGIGFYANVVFQDGVENWDGVYLITGLETGFDGNEEQVQTLDLAPVALTSRTQIAYSPGS